jgi:hypothetical protein
MGRVSVGVHVRKDNRARMPPRVRFKAICGWPT